MTVTVRGGESARRSPVAPRRAVSRWARRLVRREWRQQLLIIALVTVAVAATVLASSIATATPPPIDTGFGTAHDLATYSATDPHLATTLASLRHRFGRVEVIENEAVTIPGSVTQFSLRAQDPHGTFSAPLLALVSGRYPSSANEVAVTAGVASAFHLAVGTTWRFNGTSRAVVGIVENPENLIDEFALVPPGTIAHPTQVTAFFDAPGVDPGAIGPTVRTPGYGVASNALNPESISIAALVLGLLLITLVATGGFTVIAQRRARAFGMLEAIGARDRLVRRAVRANGLAVGAVGAAAGFVIGLGVWLAYRPTLETSAHHRVGVFAMPWPVIALALVLAPLATYLAAARPARAVTRVSIVSALSGRPAPPKRLRRSALPGIACIVVAVLLLGYAGAGSFQHRRTLELALGLVMLIPGVILLSPFILTALARFFRRAPIAVRIALRDLARYRARSGAALSAITVGVLVAVVVSVVASARFGTTIDYVGPNLAANQMMVYPESNFGNAPTKVLHPNGQGVIRNASPAGSAQSGPAPTVAEDARNVRALAASLDATSVLALEQAPVLLHRNASGRNWSGQIYVATPSLLKAYGIDPASIPKSTDILTMRPGLAGLSKMELLYGSDVLSPTASLVANPTIQYEPKLPAGTSAPNTVVTESALHRLHLSAHVNAWLVDAPAALTASEISASRVAAANEQLQVETHNSVPTLATIVDWATVFALIVALGVLAMSVGLLRSETGSVLRTLTAAGASSRLRRSITAATAGALGFAGAVLGTAAGYIGVLGFFRTNAENGGIGALANPPTVNLVATLVVMPLLAAAAAWLLAGRIPASIARQPIE